MRNHSKQGDGGRGMVGWTTLFAFIKQQLFTTLKAQCLIRLNVVHPTRRTSQENPGGRYQLKKEKFYIKKRHT